MDWINNDSVRKNKVSPYFIPHTKTNPNKLNIQVFKKSQKVE